jgi:hypothetical protein
LEKPLVLQLSRMELALLPLVIHVLPPALQRADPKGKKLDHQTLDNQLRDNQQLDNQQRVNQQLDNQRMASQQPNKAQC